MRNNNRSSLINKTAIITGGSGGIGIAIAEVMLREGARIVLADCSRTRLDASLGKLNYSDKVEAVLTNVAEIEQVENLVTKALQKFGSIDILVNAAGIQAPIGPFVEADLDDWIRNINVNFIGTAICCRMV